MKVEWDQVKEDFARKDAEIEALQTELDAYKAHAPKWVNVADELPPMPSTEFKNTSSLWVLGVCVDLGSIYVEKVRYRDNGREQWWKDTSGDRVLVTLWMPMVKLPEPPTNNLKAPDKEVTA